MEGVSGSGGSVASGLHKPASTRWRPKELVAAFCSCEAVIWAPVDNEVGAAGNSLQMRLDERKASTRAGCGFLGHKGRA